MSDRHAPVSAALDCLRAVSARDARLQRLQDRMRSAGLEAWRAHRPVAGRFLRFRLYYDSGSITCLANVDQWANAVFPELAGIAWSAVPPEQIHTLATGVESPLEFSFPLLAYRSAALTDVFDAAATDFSATPVTPLTLVCRTTQATVYFEDAPECIFGRGGMSASLARVAVAVEFLVGYSAASARLLAKMRVGDAILIERQHPIARYRDHTLFSYSTAASGLIIEDIIMQHSPHDYSPDIDDHEARVDLGEVLLSVEFILWRKDYLVSELSSLDTGQLIELPGKTEQRIDIVANRRRIASGELVQIDGRLAVQICSLAKP